MRFIGNMYPKLSYARYVQAIWLHRGILALGVVKHGGFPL